jgi:hypothetical protein
MQRGALQRVATQRDVLQPNPGACLREPHDRRRHL